jgi:hypothetical protein
MERPCCRQESRPRLDSSNFAFLLDFFPARFEHLIVRCLFDTVGHKMLAQGFLFFLEARTGRAMSLGRCDDRPLLGQICILFGLLLRYRMFRTSRFQSASVNSSGSRSSINAISRARVSTMSGEGTPKPFPCSEIFPAPSCE